MALAAAFTSISLRDRWRDPVVDTDLVLTVEALVVKEEKSGRTDHVEVQTHPVTCCSLLSLETNTKL